MLSTVIVGVPVKPVASPATAPEKEPVNECAVIPPLALISPITVNSDTGEVVPIPILRVDASPKK